MIADVKTQDLGMYSNFSINMHMNEREASATSYQRPCAIRRRLCASITFYHSLVYLRTAVVNGHQALVEMLLRRGASIDTQDKDGDTFYEMAATARNEQIILAWHDQMLKKARQGQGA